MNFIFSLNFLLLIILFILSPWVRAEPDLLGRPLKAVSRSNGQLGVLVDTGLYTGETTATANPVTLNQWQTNTSIVDFKIGYIAENSLYYGFKYTTRSDNQISLTASAGEAAGLGVGYFLDQGFNARLFYLFSESFGNYAKGTGFSFDLGYMMNLTANFYLGISVSNRQTTFTLNNTIAGFSNWTRYETYPFINLGFVFN